MLLATVNRWKKKKIRRGKESTLFAKNDTARVGAQDF